MGKYDHINFKPPESAANAAKRGLELRKKNKGKGGLSSGEASKQGIGSGVQRASDLSNRENMSPETVKRMKAFFDRHQKNKKPNKGTPREKDKGYIAWCLKGNSEILLADGSSLPISEIVDNKMEVEVFSYNEKTNEFEPKKITGWSKAPSSIEDYFIVGKHKTMRQGISDRTFLAATAEHPFFVDDEWVEAKDMEGRHLSVVDEGLDSISEQVLLGTLLGDACIWKSSASAGTLRMAHGQSQKEYLDEKSRLLFPLIGGSYDTLQKVGYGAGKTSCRSYTRSTLYLSEIQSRFYDEEGIKRVTPQLLANLDDVAVAFWLMDDGKLKFSERDGHSSWILHTEGFDEESVENIVQFLREKYEINAYAVPRENTEGSAVYFTTEGTKKMMSRLSPFFHPSMRHKVLPEYRDIPYALEFHEPNTKMVICQQPVTRFGQATKEYASKAARKPYKWAWRYNIEVEGNHNFIANGILVHNCLWGGDPGYSWAKKVVKQMEAADEKAKKKKSEAKVDAVFNYILLKEAKNISDIGMINLDVSDIIPGSKIDATDVLWHAKDGDYLQAAKSLISCVPNSGHTKLASTYRNNLINAVFEKASENEHLAPYVSHMKSALSNSVTKTASVPVVKEKPVTSCLDGVTEQIYALAGKKKSKKSKKNKKSKKSKSKSKNKPTNPKLWAECKAAAKKKFDVYPSAYCVPTHSEALTKDGWKYHHELSIGEEILAYSINNDSLEWTKLVDIHFFPDEETIKLKKQTLDVECTPNHNWLYYRNSIKPEYNDEKLEKIWKYIQSIKSGKEKISHIKKEFSSIQAWYKKYNSCSSLEELKEKSKHTSGVKLIKAKDISENGFILATAPYKNNESKFVKTSSKYNQNWIDTILNMNEEQIEAFFMGCVICDGWQVNEKTFGFSQKHKNHADAFELAAFLSGRRVRRRYNQEREMSFFSAIDKRHIPLTNIKKDKSKIQDVWCPETELGTWVMRQNGHVLITGNSNAWAAKQYKKKGGGWKKACVEYALKLYAHNGGQWVKTADVLPLGSSENQDIGDIDVTLSQLGPIIALLNSKKPDYSKIEGWQRSALIPVLQKMHHLLPVSSVDVQWAEIDLRDHFRNIDNFTRQRLNELLRGYLPNYKQLKAKSEGKA